MESLSPITLFMQISLWTTQPQITSKIIGEIYKYRFRAVLTIHYASNFLGKASGHLCPEKLHKANNNSKAVAKI